ncbi:MAG: DUF2442 domain-containing protein [Acidobacteria bacterium]|jgi:hypothetical protein|nr:DUF2442 domain-containing protein [Acidobacteriota bacterium]
MAELINEKLEINEAEFERQFVEATRRGEKEMANAPKAKKVNFDRKTKRLLIDLQNGITILVPISIIQIFQNATNEEIADVELLLNGLYLRWNQLDEDLSVPNLLEGRFGTPKWMSKLNSKINKTENKPQKKVA